VKDSARRRGDGRNTRRNAAGKLFLRSGRSQSGQSDADIVLDDRFEARGLQALFCGLHGFQIRVRTNLHAVIFIALRGLYEAGNSLLRSSLATDTGVRLSAQRDHLQ